MAQVNIVNDPAIHGGEPVIAGTTLRVAEVVVASYDGGIAAATELTKPTLATAVVREAIDYCALRACEDQKKFCKGCRLATEHAGWTTFDEYLAQFSAVHVEAGGLRLMPGGTAHVLTVPSLEVLAKEWRGEKIHYLARRVIRRLKNEADPRLKQMSGGLDGGPSPAFILVRPQLADNIGMVARAMANFGLDDLRLVAPRDGWPNEKARVAASGADFIIDVARATSTLPEAIGELNWVCATTARQRDLAKPVLTPEQAVVEMRRRLDLGQRVGVLFGPERTGLEGDDVAIADAVVMVPVNPNFASLNLAQAALLFGYEWMKENAHGTLGRVTTYESPLVPGQRTRGSELATKHEMMGLFEHLESELERLGFFNPSQSRDALVRNVRTMLTRMSATEQEVRTLRGIVATLAKGKGRARKPST